MSHPLVIIPARMAAMRLPGKPLADIAGAPMIVHVWRRALAADIGPVVVAAGDAEIVQVIEAHGGRAVLTDPQLASGSDRVRAAAAQIDPDGAHDVLINVQGDVPDIDPAIVRSVLLPLADSDIDVATPVCPLPAGSRVLEPSVVKAVLAPATVPDVYRVLYFSRNPVPHGEGPFYEHIGVYAYRRAVLDRFVSLPPAPLELRERLEQLRLMADGARFGAVIANSAPISVDTPDDLIEARQRMAAGGSL